MDDYNSDTSYAGPDLSPAVAEPPSYTPDIPVADPPYMSQTPTEYLGVQEPTQNEVAADETDREAEASDEAAFLYAKEVGNEGSDGGSEEASAFMDVVQADINEFNETVAAERAREISVEWTPSVTDGEPTEPVLTIGRVVTSVHTKVKQGGRVDRSDGKLHMHVAEVMAVYVLDIEPEKAPAWKIDQVSLAGRVHTTGGGFLDLLANLAGEGFSQQRYMTGEELDAGAEPYEKAPGWARTFAEGNLPFGFPPGLV